MKIKQPTIIEGWDAYRKLVDEQLKKDHLDRLRKLHEKRKKYQHDPKNTENQSMMNMGM